MKSPDSHKENIERLALALRGKPASVGMAALLALAAVLGGFNRYSFLPTSDYTHPRPVSGIGDARLYYYPSFGLMSQLRQGWPQAVKQPDEPPLRALRLIGLGQPALEHPEFHLIDRPALADPFLARLPADHRQAWRPGHHRRRLPTDYLRFVVGRAETIADASLRGLLDDAQLAAQARRLFTWERLRAIWRLNSGHYAGLDLRRYQDPQTQIPIVSADSCFSVSLDELEAEPKPAAYNWPGRSVLGRFYRCLRVAVDAPRRGVALSVSLGDDRDYEVRVNGELVKTIARRPPIQEAPAAPATAMRAPFAGPEPGFKHHRALLPRPTQVTEIEIRALRCHPPHDFWVGHLLIRQERGEALAHADRGASTPSPLETDLLQDGVEDPRRRWTVKGPGRFAYDVARIDGAPALTVRALEDMPWLAVFIQAKDLGDSRHHWIEAEAGNTGDLRLYLETWDFEGEAEARHASREIDGSHDCEDWQALPLDFGADRQRDYAAVVAQGIKAGEEFRIHRLRLSAFGK